MSLFGRAPTQKINLPKYFPTPDDIRINTVNRDKNEAKNAFKKLIAPNDNFEYGIYSNAYKDCEKKKVLEEFLKKLKTDDYDVYDWNNIYTDLWSKKIDENDYEPNASKSGILVTAPDGRKILVKNYNSNYYSYPKGGINKGENPRDAAMREFIEETTINIKPYESKMVGKCMDWKYTLELSTEEYNKLIQTFNEKTFREEATPEVSGIKIEAGDISITNPYLNSYKKYLKYKNKYLELKKILNN
jgi:8-oxo-dGTP pyrophosphatase MutT (NUDIX family)